MLSCDCHADEVMQLFWYTDIGSMALAPALSMSRNHQALRKPDAVGRCPQRWRYADFMVSGRLHWNIEFLEPLVKLVFALVSNGHLLKDLFRASPSCIP